MSKILLLGDTQIERFPKFFIENDNNQIINAGIKNIEVLKYSKILPKIFNKVGTVDYIILQIGLSDLLKLNLNKDNKKNILEITDYTKKLIYDLSKKDASLIVLPIYPTRYKELNKKIMEFNDIIARMCYEGEIEFLDIYEIFLDDENLLKSNYTNNGFKLNKTGHLIVANQINEYIRLIEKDYFK